MSVQDAEQVMLLTKQLGYKTTINEIAANIKKAAEAPYHLLLVATIDTKVVEWIHAFKAFYVESKFFIEIGGLVVDENYRGKGIGKTLINEIKQWCMQKGSFQLALTNEYQKSSDMNFIEG